MAKTVMTVENDRIDLICWKHYASLEGRIVERVIEANPGVSMTSMLPAGMSLYLPDIEPVRLEQTLW